MGKVVNSSNFGEGERSCGKLFILKDCFMFIHEHAPPLASEVLVFNVVWVAVSLMVAMVNDICNSVNGLESVICIGTWVNDPVMDSMVVCCFPLGVRSNPLQSGPMIALGCSAISSCMISAYRYRRLPMRSVTTFFFKIRDMMILSMLQIDVFVVLCSCN